MCRIAVVGCGHWGKNLIRVAHELGVLAAVSDVNNHLSQSFAKMYNVEQNSINDICNRQDIDGVILSTPAQTHYEIAEQIIKSGKHIFIEKPITLNIKDAERLIDIAKHHKVKLMIGHLLRYHAAFKKMLDLIDSGICGNIKRIISRRLSSGIVRDNENVLWSFAPHDISMIIRVANSPIKKISSNSHDIFDRGIEDCFESNIEFKNGVHASLEVSWAHPQKEQTLFVVGDKASLIFDDRENWNKKLKVVHNNFVTQEKKVTLNKGKEEYIELPESEPLVDEIQHFVQCCKTDGEPLTCGKNGLEVISLLHDIELSVNKKKENTNYFSHPSSYIDDSAIIGKDTKIWHFSHIMPNVLIGNNCSLGQSVFVASNVTIGNNCKIQNNVSLYSGVTLEDGVFCGPSCVFTNVINPRAEIERKDEFLKTKVRYGATIGANATIVCGNEIGKYSFIAAGSVITKDVPDFALVMGVPGKRVGWMSKHGARLSSDFKCPISGEMYEEYEKDGSVFLRNKK